MQKVLGGFVRTYEFTYNFRNAYHDGTMYIELDGNLRLAKDITVVILSDRSEPTSVLGNEIVQKTQKLSNSGGGELLVQAYFSTYCRDIRKYIIVYERFTDAELEASFFDDASEGLSENWRKRMRCVVL